MHPLYSVEWMSVNDELVEMQKEAVVTYFKILSEYQDNWATG